MKNLIELPFNPKYILEQNVKYGLNFNRIPENCINVLLSPEDKDFPTIIINNEGIKLLWSQLFNSFHFINNDPTRYLTWLNLSRKWYKYKYENNI